MGIYFAYFYWQSNRLPKILRITSYDSIKVIPPAICHFSWSNGDGGMIEGDMHVVNGITRFDYIVKIVSKSTSVHMVVTQEGTAFAWNEAAHQGIRGRYEDIAVQTGLSNVEAVPCSTWWVPDAMKLFVPQDVTFL